MAQPNAKWYDEATLEEMHADLKTEYLKTLAVITNRPMLLKHFNSCAECQTLHHAHHLNETYGSPDGLTHRRRKVVLRYSQIHALLGLKSDQAVVALEIKQDPMTLSLIVTGPDEPNIPVDVESPMVWPTVEAG
jgi:hypothetical protein